MYHYDVSEFSGVWDDVGNWFEDTFTTPDFVKQAESWLTELKDDAIWKIQEAIDEMNRLLEIQNDVDQAIAELPDDAPEKSKLIKERDESRGAFEDYVLPAWSKFASLVGIDQDPEKAKEATVTMGAVPVIVGVVGVGAVAAAAAVIYWSKRHYDREETILQDAELAKTFYSQTGITGNLAKITNTLKWPLIILGATGLGYVGLKYVGVFKK